MSEWINTASDWVSSHLPALIAIVTSGAFVGALINFLLGLWRIKIQSRETAKNNAVIAGKYEKLEERVNNVITTLEGMFEKLMKKYADLTKEQFNELMAQYQKTKQAYLQAVVNADKETELLIAKAKEIAEAQAEQEKAVENSENIENIAVSEPVTENYEEEVKAKENEPQIESSEEEYIVVEKTYGE